MTSIPYDAIMGRDLARRLGIDVLNSRSLVTMGDVGVPFVDRNSEISALFNYDKIEDIGEDAADRLKKILDAKYEQKI